MQSAVESVARERHCPLLWGGWRGGRLTVLTCKKEKGGRDDVLTLPPALSC